MCCNNLLHFVKLQNYSPSLLALFGGTIVVGPIIDSDSELSTVSSSRLSGLEEDWWKEKTGSSSTATAMTTAVENAETSTATATATARVTRTRSKGKRVHWK